MELARQIMIDEWRPDYIVGLTRGGLIPATLLSHYLSVPMNTLKVQLRDGGCDDTESNCWMAEDAFDGKNILIVDDINDSGATINWIKNDWKSICLPHDPKWDNVWGNNVRIATLFDNESSESTVDVTYNVAGINKANEDVWIVFPWENFWWKSNV